MTDEPAHGNGLPQDDGNGGEAHSPLDTLLGATPRHVARHWLSLLLLALAALGAAVFFVRFVTGEDSPYYSAQIERGDMVPHIAERGELHVAGEMPVSSSLAGHIAWLSDKTTGPVRQGELLARIDAAQTRDAVTVEAADLSSAQASLSAAQIGQQEAGSKLARFEMVWRRSGGRVPSLNEMEAARAQAQRASLAVTTARAAVDAARVRVKAGQVALAQAEIRAPIDGILIRRLVGMGQAVEEGQPLFTIASPRAPLTIEVPFPMLPPGQVRPGMTAQVRLDEMPDTPQIATLTQVIPPPPLLAGPAHAQFTIQRPDPQVHPGMAATIEIELPARRNVLLVPDAALAFDPQSASGARPPSIYLLSKNGEPARVTVTVGASDGTRTEVFGTGLAPGDHVVIGWRAAAPEKSPAPARSGR